MGRTVKVTLSLPREVAEFIDQLAALRAQPRSSVVSDLLDEKRRELFHEELAQAYLDEGGDAGSFARGAISLAAESWPDYEGQASETR